MKLNQILILESNYESQQSKIIANSYAYVPENQNDLSQQFINDAVCHRISSKDLRVADSPDRALLPKKEEEVKKSRVNLQYSSSLSVCRSMGKKEALATTLKEARATTTPVANGLFDDLASPHGTVKLKVWREKVIQVLGEQKIKNKTKVIT